MFFRHDLCPNKATLIINFCATKNWDHIKCCIKNGIKKTIVAEKCFLSKGLLIFYIKNFC